jgi:glycosyltransferase involved in cell wall biosynthesis
LNNFVVAVVTPVFNGGDFILRTLLATQGAAAKSKQITIHHFIADAASTDGTSKLISDFAANNRLENYIISHDIESDNGLYDGLAKGFSRAMESGANIYCYINAGDYFSPHAFDIVHQSLSGDVDWLTGLDVLYNEKGELINAILPFKYDTKLLSRGFYGTHLPFVQQESTFWSSKAMSLIDLSALARHKLAGDYYIWHTFAKEKLELNIVNAWLGGFAITRGQLSELYFYEYLEEFASIRDKRSPVDFFRVFVAKLCWYLPSSLKIKLNSKIITR